MSGESKALLVDITKCIGCRSCMEACKTLHGQSGDPFTTEELSANTYTVVSEREDNYVRKMCMHCETPSCASVCPVGAMHKTAEGPVVYDSTACLGCRYCIQACPFGVPRYTWDKAVPSVAKCDMCIDRQRNGQATACTESCPTGATMGGTRADLLAEAHRRIAESPDDYFPHVYGEHEVGGTSVLFLSPVSFAALGFNEGLGDEPLPMYTQEALERVPGIVTVGGALLLAIWWITQRREEVALAEAAESGAAGDQAVIEKGGRR